MIVAEILGGEGQVLSRIRLHGTSVAGTDRGCDLVLDDAGIEPRHVEMSEGADGTVALRRLADRGETRIGSLVLGTEAEVALPATVTIGGVVLRLSRGEPDQEAARAASPSGERAVPGAARAWSLLGVIVLVVVAWEFFTTYKAHPWSESLTTSIGIVMLILLWTGAWALGNRLFGYRGRFNGHLVAVSSWTLIVVPAGVLVAIGAQIVRTDATQALSVGFNVLMGTWLLYRHIGVASRWRARTNALIAVAIVASLVGLGSLSTDTNAAQPVDEALTSLEPLPAALYMTEPSSAVASQVDGILRGLRGMHAKRSVSRASH